jgi:hypothetical protein
MNARTRTSVQAFALYFGIIYALVGILGLIPGILQPPAPGAPALVVDTAYGYLLGLFPVNLLHDAVHLLVGVLGIVASGRFAAARGYSRAVAIVFVLLTIMGLVPGLDTTLGLIPLFGADVVLHALTAVVSAYFGWFARESSAPSGVARGAV